MVVGGANDDICPVLEYVRLPVCRHRWDLTCVPAEWLTMPSRRMSVTCVGVLLVGFARFVQACFDRAQKGTA